MRARTPAPVEIALVLMAFTAGSADVNGLAELGGIFPSAMTGNLAFLAFYSAAGAIYSAIGSLIALAGFIAGASAGTLLTRDRPDRNAINILLGAETLLLAGAAALWFAATHPAGHLSTDALILAFSSAMGLQSICGKKINLSSIPTIVFTSTLTNIVIAVTESLAARKKLPPGTRRQLVSFSMYFAGASSAGLLAFFNSELVILLPLVAAALALLVHAGRTRGF